MNLPQSRAYWPFQVMAALLIVALAVMARSLFSGYKDLDIARQAREAGLQKTAVDYYSRASRWYLPLVGKHEPARHELASLCREAQESDVLLALRCWRELRGAILATRWFYTPDKDLLEEANRAIATIVAKEKRPDGSPVLPESLHLELLQRDEAPDPWLSFLAVLLFFSWLGTLSYGLWTSMSPDGVITWRRLIRFIFWSVGLAGLWLLALRFA